MLKINWLGCFVFIYCFNFSVPVYANNQVNKFNLNIQSQHLGKALLVFARQTKQAIIFDPIQLNSVNAEALNGVFSIADALSILLNNTEFEAVKLNGAWVIQHKVPPELDVTITPVQQLTKQKTLMEEVTVVASYADSVKQALKQKQVSAQNKDIILASEMDQFPALNLADALNRMPGVSVERDRGEALFVSVRGLPSQFNHLTINGHRIASNENVRTSTQYGRRFHYDILPAELIESVSINKTPVAEQAYSSIGATVDLKTFTPVGSRWAQNKVKFSVSQSELTDQLNPRFSLWTNWLNSQENAGVSFSLAYSKRSIRQDRALSFDWNIIEQTDFLAEPIVYAATLRPTLEFEQRENWGINTSAFWQFSQSSLHFNWLSLHKDIDYQEFAYSADYQFDLLESDSLGFEQQVLNQGNTTKGSVQISAETAGMLDTVNTFSLQYKTELNSWLLFTDFASSKAESINDEPIQRTRLRLDNSVEFSFIYPRGNGQKLPIIEYKSLDLTDPTMFPGRRLEWRLNKINDSQNTVSLKLIKNIDNYFIDEIKFGIEYNWHSRFYQRRDRIISNGIEGQYFSADYFNLQKAHFLAEANTSLPDLWLLPDTQTFWQNIDLIALKQSESLPADLANSYHITEKNYSGFAQVEFEYSRLWGNLGLRASSSSVISQGYHLNSMQNKALAVKFNNQYQNLLPALNLVFAIDNNWQWRVALAKTLSHPDLPDLSPRLTFNSGDIKTAIKGNPYLKPTQAWQIDFGLHYYGLGNRYYGVNGFIKQLKNFVQPAYFNAEFDGDNYWVESTSNGAEAEVKGIELIAQQSFYDLLTENSELGFSLNLTLTASNAQYIYPQQTINNELAGVAKNTFNAELFYLFNQWAFRANYNYTSDILLEISQSNQPARYKNHFGFLGSRISYQLNDKANLFIEGTNLLNQSESEYVLNGYFTNYSYYGRTFSVGIQFGF
ncbi:TonB-dependent receptor [Catenovulum sp. 2E275]|uniref:TonB-dependent receptor n=1 Tax=Catenovulum sp. 2E275 TaxID=2980497 RepID=UPI0021CEB00F|nr:TonB-dependent receptor [Catenovulum sp. 2E275]MCU4675177.1 TonB-dependent receptor [Catenovulum sp. 2E275]